MSGVPESAVEKVAELLVRSGRGALPYPSRLAHARIILDAAAPDIARAAQVEALREASNFFFRNDMAATAKRLESLAAERATQP